MLTQNEKDKITLDFCEFMQLKKDVTLNFYYGDIKEHFLNIIDVCLEKQRENIKKEICGIPNANRNEVQNEKVICEFDILSLPSLNPKNE